MTFTFKPAKYGITVFLSAALAGCGIISDKNVEYQKAQVVPTLEVPPPLTITHEDDLELPKGAEIKYSEYDREHKEFGTVSRDTGVLDLPAGMTLQRDGNTRWLIVGQSADTLWPKLRQFWQDNGFKISREAPRLGILETDWAENRAAIPSDLIRRTIGRLLDFAYDTGYRDKYRTRLEQGEKSGTTEVYITHQGVEEVSKNDTFVWQPRPSDPGLEAEMLKRLMVVLGANEQTAEQKIVAVGEAVAPKIQLGRDSAGQPAIDYPAGFAETWRQVGLALDRGDFTVEDRNREAGDYYVRYIGKETSEGPGFLSKLAFWRDDENEKKRIYLLHISHGEQRSQITLLQEDKQAMDSPRAESILQILHEHLR